MSREPDCPFCEIIQRGDSDAREIYRDEYVVAFFPTEPAVLGHTLLVPRAHEPDVWSLSEAQAEHLAAVTLRLAGAIRAGLVPEGLNIIQSNGEAATQSVFHLHIHLVPRWEGDAMGTIWPEKTDYDEMQKDAAQDRIRVAIREGRGT